MAGQGSLLKLSQRCNQGYAQVEFSLEALGKSHFPSLFWQNSVPATVYILSPYFFDMWPPLSSRKQ